MVVRHTFITNMQVPKAGRQGFSKVRKKEKRREKNYYQKIKKYGTVGAWRITHLTYKADCRLGIHNFRERARALNPEKCKNGQHRVSSLLV